MSPYKDIPSVDHVAFLEHVKSPLHDINEIDLIDLLTSLWLAKKRVIIIIFVCMLTGCMVYLFQPQAWTSKAIITPVESTQLDELQETLADIQILGVDYSVDRDDMFNLFIKKFESQRLVNEYIRSAPALVGKLVAAGKNADAFRHTISEIAEQMKASNNYTGKNESDQPFRSWTLSFTGAHASDAQDVLSGYIAFISDKTASQIVRGIRNALALKLNTEREKLTLDRVQLQNSHNSSILRLGYARKIAQAANITEPVYGKGQIVSDDPDFSVTLGTKGISSKLEIEKTISDFTELNPDIKNREYRLARLEEVSIKNTNIPVINFQQSPTYPIKKDGPGIVVFLILSALIGGIAGCASVLLCHAIAVKKRSS
ncbi:Ferric enterobactin transport protein fepE [Cedecea neteri]|uniref:Ferric enterobactin transport protein fepE n=1 Tax=Cedecea neteri TaxID=158822 RepID=A0A291E5W2_9ENTR|nr:LPS O-antigen length regulator Wzz(fepE) [Cedecea neteri]ATF95454.1 LPS O-antigen length regulator [Cedecea neteri]SQC92121.1 Ferric enterobactin transport protein fepE [Cedecea neteri]